MYILGMLFFCRHMIVTLVCDEGQTTPKFAFEGEPTQYQYVSIL